MTEEEKVSRLTPAMRGVLIGVGVVVVFGVIVVAWLLTSADSNGGGANSGASASVTPTQGPLPDATPTSGSEVLPPTAAPAATLPPLAPPDPSAPTAPLVAPPYPASATADGELVDGFPSSILSAFPDSDVLQSAIATQGEVMQATLGGRTDASPDEVRAFYAALWSGLGLADQSADGSMSYVGRSASLSLSFTTAGTGTRYTVFGVFRAS